MTTTTTPRHLGRATKFWLCDICTHAIAEGDRMVAIETGDAAKRWIRTHPICARQHPSFNRHPHTHPLPDPTITSFASRAILEGNCRWCDRILNCTGSMAAVVQGTHNITGWLPFHTTCVPTTLTEFWTARPDAAPAMLAYDGPSYEVRTLEEDQVTGMRSLDELSPDKITTAHLYGRTNRNPQLQARFDRIKSRSR
jgi:hypothetical protein